MALKTGAALLIGLVIGTASTIQLTGAARDRQITALQVAQCTKGDKAADITILRYFGG